MIRSGRCNALWVVRARAVNIYRAARYADDGYAAWLRFMPLDSEYSGPREIVVECQDRLAWTAAQELQFGLECLYGECLEIGTGPSLSAYVLRISADARLVEDGFCIRTEGKNRIIEATNPRGLLYGVFSLLRATDTRQFPKEQPWIENPSAPIRYLNHWDNLDGSIERGYAGRSIFYGDDGQITGELDRVRDYARLLASVGINGCSINNVNADDRIYSTEGLSVAARLASVFREFGIRILISVSLDSPVRQGGLNTFDPLDPGVNAWWKAKAAEMYQAIPDMAGLLIKADSEGRLGPSAYGRTHADAANLLARAVRPHGGMVFYRGFVYNHTMDWHDRKLDRAKAQQENLQPLDGLFDENVAIQIKNGPIDFQVREPVSPTIGSLEKTPKVIELMITQEYLGQQHHSVYEVPWWKNSLDFDFELNHHSATQDIVTGKTFGHRMGGFVAVCGVGRSINWMGNDLAQANLYGYGRLAWNPNISAEQIAEEWVAQTFSRDKKCVAEVRALLMDTWPTYERYTGNLGIGGLTDIIHVHYGPAPESSEHNGWGQWHRSDATGTGMDRTIRSGTGFTAQYPAKVATQFENLETCPEELLLFFHHVPYSHRLKSGKTVIQHIYDEHYRGAQEASRFVDRWKGVRQHVDRKRWLDVLGQLEYQAGHAVVWRDSICWYFHRLSGIADSLGRVGNEPHRVECESMTLDGYEIVNIEPWEAASGARAIRLRGDAGSCQTAVDFDPGRFKIHTWFFDLPGNARFELRINDNPVDQWTADMGLPSEKLDAHTRQRHTTGPLSLAQGDVVSIHCTADKGDVAALDFLEFEPVSHQPIGVPLN
ncbi:MAG: glucosiduronase [Armatimonadetes bacterium]|nr:glucosiduronase [Armatimonadota bacterium]